MLLLSPIPCSLSPAFAQQPQTQTAPVFAVNAKYVQGVGPGYWPTAGSGLTLNLAAGTATCGDPPAAISYAGGTLAMTGAATNYVYLDPAASCAPAKNTTGFQAGQIPLAKVVTSGGAITSVTDARNWFQPSPCAMSSTGAVNCSALGTNQDINLKPSGTGGFLVTTAGSPMATFTGGDDGGGYSDFGVLAAGTGILPYIKLFNVTDSKLFGTIEAMPPQGMKLVARDGLTLSTVLNNSNITLTPHGTGSNVLNGTTRVKNLNGIRYADQFPGANAGTKIAAAIADLPSTGGTVDARGFEGAQTFSENPFADIISIELNSLKKVKLLLGDVTITTSVTIDVPGDCTIEGAGRTQTVIAYTGTGSAMTVTGVKYIHISNLTIDLAGAGTSAVGLALVSPVGAGAPVSFNTFSSIKILGSAPTSNQTGIKVDAQGTVAQEWVTWNRFDNFLITFLKYALNDVGNNNEANMFSNFNIDTCAESGYAVTVNGQRNFYNGFWIGFNTAFGSTSGGFNFTTDSAGNIVFAMGDMGSASLFTDDSGGGNTPGDTNLLIGRVITVTVLGNSSGKYSNPLGPGRDSGYQVNAASITGADRQVFMAGVSGYSNGFSVDYKDSPQKMVYSFLNGRVGIGEPAPAAALHIKGSSTDASNIRFENTAASGRTYELNPYVTGLSSAGFEIRDTTAPATRLSIDSSGNVKSNGSLSAGVNTVLFSATPTFNAALGNTQKSTLTGNVTSSTLSNATAGQTLNFIICQDASGSRTFVWPTNVKGGMTVGATSSTCSAQDFIFDGANAFALSPGLANM